MKIRRWAPSLFAVGALVLLLLVTPAGATTVGSGGSISLTTAGTAYTQDFDTLASTGTSSTTPTGWVAEETGTNANTTYTAGTGSSNAGDTYSFGAAAASERAFGGLQSGNLIPTIGAQFVNDTGQTVNRLDISYTGEQWRFGATGRPADRIDFQFSTDATSLTTGNWNDADALDFTSPVNTGTVGPLNGNGIGNRTALSASVTGLSIPNGSAFWIRWNSFDAAPGADDGLAVDAFSLTPVSNPTVNLSVNDVSQSEGNAGTTTFSFTVSLSSPAPAGGVTFDIATADNSATTGDNDYVAKSLTGQTISATNSTYTFDVTVNGDTTFESDETFFVNVTNASGTGVTVTDGQGQGTIQNDETPCGQPATSIHAVQGSGSSSPLVGQAVSVEGVVVGDYQGAGQFGGYYLQEEDAQVDADPNTSEGVFVFNTATPVNAGDVVRVAGTVTEFTTGSGTLTELTSVTSASVCSTGNAVTPTALTLPVASLADHERTEGMLVHYSQTMTVTEVFTLARFGEAVLSGAGRQYSPTAVAAPGAPALAVADANTRSRIVLDDGNNQQNIDPTLYPQGGLSAANTLRVGDTISGGLTGVMTFGFSVYRLQPVGPISFTHTNPRTAAPDAVGGTLRVASFNVLNFFNGNGLGGGFPTSRGAETAFELQRQKDKEVSAILALNADIVGLMEIENDAPPNSAIEELVAALNAATAPGTWSFVNTGVVGGDEIRVALIYKPAAVTPVGAFEILDSTDDPNFIDTLNRPTLAQTFQENATGAKLTVAVNHLKSKGSDCNSVGDPDTGDGQGNCNVTRTKAAQALVSWLATDPTGSGDPDYLVIGDLNSYRYEDPITALVAGGFTNLAAAFGGAGAYSYVFDGGSGYLDHALASASLTSQVTGATDWHINADEPIALDYNVNFKSANQVNTFYAPDAYRSSDHDPVVVGLTLNAPPTVDAGGPYSVFAGYTVEVSATGNDPNGGTLTYAWDLDNNGSFETPGQSATFSAAGIATPGPRTITVRATDGGGLSAVDSATVNVVVTYASLCQLTKDLVTNPGIEQALCNKLEQAQDFAARGKAKDHDKKLQDYRDQLDQQVGKSVSAANAAQLKSLSTHL